MDCCCCFVCFCLLRLLVLFCFLFHLVLSSYISNVFIYFPFFAWLSMYFSTCNFSLHPYFWHFPGTPSLPRWKQTSSPPPEESEFMGLTHRGCMTRKHLPHAEVSPQYGLPLPHSCIAWVILSLNCLQPVYSNAPQDQVSAQRPSHPFLLWGNINSQKAWSRGFLASNHTVLVETRAVLPRGLLSTIQNNCTYFGGTMGYFNAYTGYVVIGAWYICDPRHFPFLYMRTT